VYLTSLILWLITWLVTHLFNYWLITWPVRVDGNNIILVLKVIKFIGALSLQIALKAQNLPNFFINSIRNHLHSDWSQIPSKRTKTKPLDSKIQPNAVSARFQHRCHHSLIRISCYQSRHFQNLISVFYASHGRPTRPVKCDWHWLLYYIIVSLLEVEIVELHIYLDRSCGIDFSWDYKCMDMEESSCCSPQSAKGGKEYERRGSNKS
jgi:hypothetical protein